MTTYFNYLASLYIFSESQTFLLQKADEGWFECQISSTPVISHLVYLNIAGWLIMMMHTIQYDAHICSTVRCTLHTIQYDVMSENIISSKFCTLPGSIKKNYNGKFLTQQTYHFDLIESFIIVF